MKKLFSILTVFLLSFITFTQAQNYQANLLKEMVVISNNKMTTRAYTMITFSNGSTVQIKSYAEAPSQGVISRDNFVSIFTLVTTRMYIEMAKVDENAVIAGLDEIIGNADLEINCYIAKSGVQIESVSSQGTTRNTIKWEDMFK